MATPICPSSSSMFDRGQTPLAFDLFGFGAQQIKINDKERNTLFCIVSSLNAFFSSSCISNFSTSGEREKSHTILANAN